MYDQYVRVLFFIPRHGDDSQALEELPLPAYAAMAGVTEIRQLDPGQPAPLAGRWDGFDSVEIFLIEFEFHRCLMLQCSKNAFNEMCETCVTDRPVPLSEDGALPVATAFASACARLQPDVAMITTLPQHGSSEWIARTYDHSILGLDADGLADLRVGLLYLSDWVASDWTPSPRRDERDSFPSATGRIVFAQSGGNRWF